MSDHIRPNKTLLVPFVGGGCVCSRIRSSSQLSTVIHSSPQRGKHRIETSYSLGRRLSIFVHSVLLHRWSMEYCMFCLRFGAFSESPPSQLCPPVLFCFVLFCFVFLLSAVVCAFVCLCWYQSMFGGREAGGKLWCSQVYGSRDV